MFAVTCPHHFTLVFGVDINASIVKILCTLLEL
jgi:hypothetical protein